MAQADRNRRAPSARTRVRREPARAAYDRGTIDAVVVFGQARLVDDPREKLAGLRALTDQLLPGRWDDVRPPSRQESTATSVLVLPITEASAKLRSGPPSDGGGPDGELDVWAGEIPFVLRAGAPVPDPALAPGVAMPEYVRAYERPGLVQPADPVGEV